MIMTSARSADSGLGGGTDMQEIEKVEVTIVQIPEYVRYKCPHCGEEVEVDYDDFNDDRIDDYWPDWEGDTVICDECGAEFVIGSVEVD